MLEQEEAELQVHNLAHKQIRCPRTEALHASGCSFDPWLHAPVDAKNIVGTLSHIIIYLSVPYKPLFYNAIGIIGYNDILLLKC